MNGIPLCLRWSLSPLAAKRLLSIAPLFAASIWAAPILVMLALAPRAWSQETPNIVVILADDLGYGDVGPYDHDGDPETPMVSNTPRLDLLAAEGVTLTDFYMCASICTPSRAGLLTGRNSARVGIKGVLGPNAPCGLAPAEITLAELLKTRDYATELVGKWHLGTGSQYSPIQQGFDDFYGIPYSNDMFPYVILHDTTNVDPCPDQSSLMQAFLVEGKSFISSAVADAKPFFLYMPSVAVHVPVYVGSSFDGITGRGLYADCVYELDWCVGELLDHLAQLGVAENTIVIFTSDNGPWDDSQAPPQGEDEAWRWVGGSAGPLRGWKGTVYEGGIRVPFIARWPGHFAAGVTQSDPAVCMDLLPTLALAAGAELPTDRVLDGRDLRALLSGTGSRGSDDLFFYRISDRCDASPESRKLWALRSGPWKLHFDSFAEPTELYDLSTDIGETTPLDLPAITAMLLDKAHNFDCGLDAPPMSFPPSTNMALGRPTSASSSVECNASGQAVDGSLSTGWTSASENDQWMSVDLGETCAVQQVNLRWGPNFALVYTVDVSSDAVQWTTVHSNPAGTGGETAIRFSSTYARFVRIHGLSSNNGVGYSLSEFEIHGTAGVPLNFRGLGPGH